MLTFKEKTLKRHDVNFIIAQVSTVLASKKIKGTCTNRLPTDYGQLYTTEEASKIIDDIVEDSIYFS